MKTHKVYFQMENGEPKWEIPGLLKRILASLKPGLRHELTVKIYKKNRSLEQNAYLWGCVYQIISEETGYTPDEVHQIFAEKFLSYEKKGKTFVKSTTKLNTAEMEDYLRRCREFASMELHLYVPLPGESHWAEVA